MYYLTLHRKKKTCLPLKLCYKAITVDGKEIFQVALRSLHENPETHHAAGWKAPAVLYPLGHCLLVNRSNTLLL